MGKARNNFIVFGIIIPSLFLVVVSCKREEKKVDITTKNIIPNQEVVPLKVTHKSPIGSVEGTYENFKILVGFNQTMTPLQAIPRDETEGPLLIEPAIEGKYRWLGTKTLSFIPSSPLKVATKYKVILKKDKIKSLSGCELKKDIVWSFESTRPQLLSSLPYHRQEFVDRKSYIYLNFNMEMSPGRVQDKIKIFAIHSKPSHVHCGNKTPSFPSYKEEIRFKVRQLKDDEKKTWPMEEWDDKKTLVLEPVSKFPFESEINVHLFPGLLSKEGNLGLQREEILSFKTYNVFTLMKHSQNISGGDPLILCFSNKVNIKEVLKNIKIEPTVEIQDEYKRYDYEAYQINLSLKFNLNSKYNIKISNSLKDVFGNTIDKNYNFTLNVGDYSPYVNTNTGINIVEKISSRRVPVNFLNIDSVYLEAGEISPDKAIPFLQQEELFCSDKKYESPELFKVSRGWDVNTYKNFRNKRVRLPIELKDILGEKDSGFVFVQLDIFGERYLKSFYEITDLGVTWKYSPENNLVWITSLNSTEVIENAKVQFRDDKNNILYESFTDDSGICEFPGWANLKLKEKIETYEYEDEHEMTSYTRRYEPNFWILVSKDKDNALFSKSWDFGISPWRFGIEYEENVRAEEYDIFIFTEKGLYRSGENVHIKGILRKKKEGKWILPNLKEVQFVLKTSRDEKILDENIPVNLFGSFFKDVSLPEDAPTGIWTVEVMLPKKDYEFTHTFRVEAYRPAEFEVKVTSSKNKFIAEENFSGKIEGVYLFGMPMSDAEVKWNLTREYHHLSYPKYENFLFGEYYYEEEREVISSGKGKLNKNGEYSVSLNLSTKNINTPSVIMLEGTVTSQDKRSLSGRQRWLAFPSEVLVGLFTSKYLYLKDNKVDINLITIRPSGEIVKDKEVEIKIVKVEWKSIKKARLGGRYEWVSEKIEKEIKKDKIKSKDKPFVFEFTPDEPGYYYAKVKAKDEKGRYSSSNIYFYVAGEGFAGWEMKDTDIIELVPDKKIYNVGDVAKILVKSPYDEATALVTVERELILRKWTEKLKGNADYIEIPIRSIDIPNVYVCVVLIKGRVKDANWSEEKKEDLGKPQFKIGYSNLKVDKKEKKLNVKVYSDKSEYRPGDEVSVYYEIKDHKNKEVKNSEVSLFVVDLGVLNLIDFKTPDPYEYFYGERPLSVKTIESRVNIIGERSYGEKGEERGGGGGRGGIKYREKFISTVYYKGDLKTDSNGKGKVKFTLPDNLTRFRIMVVAQTKKSEFGSGEETFVVNLPFIISASCPRFVRVGDKFKCGVVLHNRTKNEGKGSVECLAEGIKLVDNNKKYITLPPNSSREVLFSFIAKKEGKSIFKFDAKMDNEKDKLKITIPVKLPPFTEAVATFSSVHTKSHEAVIIPQNIYKDIGGVEIFLSSSVLSGMKRGIEHLLEFPYDCLEQKISRILPLIVGEDIINQFKLAEVTDEKLRILVQNVLDEVPAYQLQNGGFVYFKGSYISPCPYLSAYTMYVLKRAQIAGYKIKPDVIEKGKNFLKDVLRWNDVDWTYPYNIHAKLTTKTFCLYSLSLWEERDNIVSFASKLFEEREKIPIFGKVLLLKAGRIFDMGKNFENEMVRIIKNKIKFSSTTAHFEEGEERGWTFPSSTKITAFVIQTFCELDIPFQYKDMVIRWLVQERGKKTKPTTHENAFVFDAFSTYYKKFERDEPDFVANVFINKKEIIKEIFKGRTNESPRFFKFPLSQFEQNKLLPILISKEGKGVLYYTLRMRYAYLDNPIAFDEGFYIRKEILTLDGKEVSKFKRGEIYKVILHIVVPNTRLFAVVEDPIPSGFEPVQTFFATEASDIQRRYEREIAKQKGHWWGGFDHREYYDDKAIFFAQQLFPGEHTQVYFIKAQTFGKFLSPSTKAEEMYQPEVFGSTPQKFIKIE